MITDVRGKGLIWAIEFDRPASDEVVKIALENGLLANAVKPNAVRLVPPFVVTKEELDEAVGVIDAALTKVSE
jgi:acetylornithine/succinyldiaminopimelate/putrescine aminotransferase